LDGTYKEVPVLWTNVTEELKSGSEKVRWTSMLMVVVNAEGLATEEPLLIVVVAFSVASTEPVELIFCASENPAGSNGKINENFMVAELVGKSIN
jgi:hypothetical protein